MACIYVYWLMDWVIPGRNTHLLFAALATLSVASIRNLWKQRLSAASLISNRRPLPLGSFAYAGVIYLPTNHLRLCKQPFCENELSPSQSEGVSGVVFSQPTAE